jgi:phosphatidate cytidylyltransferase
MLLQRVITAAIGIPIIIAIILMGGALYTAAAALILGVAALELFTATDPERPEPEPAGDRRGALDPFLRVLTRRIPALIAVAGVALLAVMAGAGFSEWLGALAGLVAAVFLALVVRGDPATGLRDLTWALAGVLYIGVLGSHLVFLRELPDGEKWMLLAVLSTWSTDTFSYFVGRALGRMHVTPVISPRKTLEGYLAGWAGGIFTVIVLGEAFGLDAPLFDLALLAVLLPPVAMLGDLGESLIKRGAEVKDMSEFVPGHGGFLDRLDSVLFTVPLVYYFVIWVVF